MIYFEKTIVVIIDVIGQTFLEPDKPLDKDEICPPKQLKKEA